MPAAKLLRLRIARAFGDDMQTIAPTDTGYVNKKPLRYGARAGLYD